MGVVLALAAVVLAAVAVLASRGTVPLLGVLAVLCLTARPVRQRLGTLVREPLGATLASFLVWALATTSWSPERAHGQSVVLSAALLALAGLVSTLAARTVPVRGARLAAGGLVWGAALLLALTAIELMSGSALLGLARALVGASGAVTVNSINPATAILALLAVAALPVLARRSGGLAVLFLLAVLAVLALAPMAAAAIAAALGALVAALALRAPRATTGFVLAVILLALLGAPLLRSLVDPDAAWIGELPASWRHRVLMWQFVAERIAERPWFGWGFDAARGIPGGDAELFVGALTVPLHPHNLALQVWLELGAVGAVLFAAIALVVLGAPLRPEGAVDAPAAAALAATWAVLAFANYGAWQNWWLALAWLIATLAIAAARAAAAEPE
ncbi:MAG: O-antigen ligase family protein [Alphaproteobacteria bacterium]|nr:O-antigen ligase family protein [Alphaproteobacteria bacterium]